MPKKCPICNSTRYEKINGDFKCARCGFTNKSRQNLKKSLEKTSQKVITFKNKKDIE